MKMQTHRIKICIGPLKQCLLGNMALHAFIRKEKRPQINDLSIYLKKLEKEMQVKPKVSRKKKSRNQ